MQSDAEPRPVQAGAQTPPPEPGGPDAPRAADATPAAEDLNALRAKAAQYDDLWSRHLRALADQENLRKRIQRDAAERAQYAIEEFARELLPVADNLARAVRSCEQGGSIAQTVEGIRLVEKQLGDVFARHGIQPIAAQPGQPFDPAHHEAVGLAPSEEHPPNAILQETQRGYRLHQRLLRPTSVIVSAPKTGPSSDAPAP